MTILFSKGELELPTCTFGDEFDVGERICYQHLWLQTGHQLEYFPALEGVFHTNMIFSTVFGNSKQRVVHSSIFRGMDVTFWLPTWRFCSQKVTWCYQHGLFETKCVQTFDVGKSQYTPSKNLTAM